MALQEVRRDRTMGGDGLSGGRRDVRPDYCAAVATFSVAAMWPKTGPYFARPSG